MAILKLMAMLGLNKTGFDAGMTDATKKVNRFGSDMKSQLAGAFTATAVIAFTKSIIDLGGEIKDSMDRLGVGAKDVQEFGLAAKLGGQSADTFAKAVEKIRLAMAAGGATGKNPLAEFGITLQDLQSGDAVGILRKLAVELENFSGSASQTKALADTFGARGMGGIVNMLRELKAAGKGNLFISNEEVELLDRAGDSLTRLWHNFKVIGAKLLFPDPGDSWLGRKLGMKSNRTASTLTPVPPQMDETESPVEVAEKIAKIEVDTAEKVGKKIAMRHIDESPLGRIGAFSGGSVQNTAQLQGIQSLRRIENALIQKGIIVRDVR